MLHSYLRIKTNAEYAEFVSNGLRKGFDSPIDLGQVPGRPYVRAGGDYFYETYALLLIILCARKGTKGALLSSLASNAIDLIAQNGENYENIISSFQGLILALRNYEIKDVEKILFKFSPLEITENQINNYKKKSIASVRFFRQKLNDAYHRNLSGIPFSKDQKQKLENIFSEKIFSTIAEEYGPCVTILGDWDVQCSP